MDPLTKAEAAQVDPATLESLHALIVRRANELIAQTPSIPGTMTSRQEDQWRRNINDLNLYGFTATTLEKLLQGRAPTPAAP